MVFTSSLPQVSLPNLPLVDYLFENYREYPDKVALIDGKSGFKLTYQQLHDKVVAVAFNLIHKYNVHKGDVVAVYLHNRWEYPLALYGISLTGAITSPTNPFYTVDELCHQLKLTNAKIVVTVPANLEKIKQAEAKLQRKFEHIFVLDQPNEASHKRTIPFERLLVKPSHALPEVAINPKEDIVLLPTSSGTTGLPKGVMLTHYNLVSNAQQMSALDELTRSTVMLAVLPMYHIYGLECFLVSTIRAGGTLVISTKYNFLDTLKFISDYKVTVAYLVPPIILSLANSNYDTKSLTSLKYIQSAAAPLDATTAQRCAAKLNCIVKQAYGMTELSPMTHLTPNNKVKVGAIGVLLPNTECRLVNVETGHEVGIDEEGEMVIRGPQAMQGYLNNPQATASTLINGWVHTGDIAKVDKDGYFYIVDRVKELIKVKGFQVAPAELEGILLTHTLVGDAAVIPMPNQESGELPYAFVVLKPNTSVTVEELKKYVADQVVQYKRLHGITFIDAIPRNPSGKILRRLLKARLPLQNKL